MTKHDGSRRCTAFAGADQHTAALLVAYAGSLRAGGYSAGSRDAHLRAVSHLVEWLTQRGLGLAELDEQLLRRFVRHLPACRCGARRQRGPRVPFRVRRFVQ